MIVLFNVLICLSSIFLIILVLIQRGRGGGLAGALGGMGGQSAFGTKAGDMFTRITIGTAFVWIVLCAMALKYMSTRPKLTQGTGTSPSPISAPRGGTPSGGAEGAGGTEPAGGEPAASK